MNTKFLSKYTSIAIITILLVMISSCSDQFVKGVYVASNREYSLNVQSASLQDIPAEGGAITFQIESSNSVNWEIQDLTDWISTPIQNGTGSQDVIFNVKPNESFTSSRTHIFNVVTTNSDWAITVPISVTQQKKSKFLSLNPSDNASWTFDSEGGSKELKISSNVEWTADCTDSFVTLSKKSGNGDASIIISVAPYRYVDVLTNRTSAIYFRDTKDEDVLQVLTITQVPLQSSIESETIKIDYNQRINSKNFSYGEVSCGYAVRSDAPWLSIVKNKDKIIDVTITADANENEEERTSQAYVYLEQSNTIKYIFNVKQQGNVITLTPQSINCGANGGTYNIEVETLSQWKVTNLNEWISVQENSRSCNLLISENNSLSYRYGEILFNRVNTAGEIIGKTIKLIVSQGSRTINSDNETLQFGPEASSQNLYIESDAKWVLTSTEDWISLSSSEGIGSKNINVSVEKNTSTSNRLGKLNLTCLGKVIEINIIQESAFINTESTSIELGATGGSAEVTLSTNLAWKAESSEQWLTISPTSGTNDGNLKLVASDNLSSRPRTAIVTISTGFGEIKMYVTQLAPTIITSESALKFDYNAGESNPIIVKADGEYSVTASSDWITFRQENNTIIIKVKENEGEARSGEVRLTLKNTTVSTSINIIQSSAPYPYIDLGLPSGTKWCTLNLGATTKEEYGTYHTWTDSKRLIPDGFAMPTREQAYELVKECSWTWLTVNSVEGYLGKGPNGNTIFLPAGGYYKYYDYGNLLYVGDEGDFWINYDNTSEYSRYPTANIIIYMHSAGTPPKIGGEAQAAKLNVRCVKK